MIQLLLNSSPIKTAYRLARESHQMIFLVGAVLRDLHLKGTISEDIDFLVERDVELIAGQFAQSQGGTCFCLEDTRGNYRAIIQDNATRHTVDFAPLYEGPISLDLTNRDFTINALALRLSDIFETGELAFIDPTGGREHLQRKLIRVCSPHAFEDDPLVGKHLR